MTQITEVDETSPCFSEIQENIIKFIMMHHDACKQNERMNRRTMGLRELD